MTWKVFQVVNTNYSGCQFIISGACCGSSKHDTLKAGIFAGNYQLVFFTPEKLLEKKWREILHTKTYVRWARALVVDEATLCLLGEADDGAGSICLFDDNAGWILASTTAWFFSSFSCKL